MKKILLNLLAVFFASSIFAQAGLQIIHNSPVVTVDIYANGMLLLDDFEYRSASPFVGVPTDATVSVAVAPGNSTSVDDAIATFDLDFEDGKNYIAVASGIVGDADFPFTIHVSDKGQIGSRDTTQIDLMVYHGSTGAPAVDVNDFGAAPFLTDLAYGNFTDGYVGLAPDLYFLEVNPTGTSDLVATFFGNLAGTGGLSGVVFASGIVGNADTPFDLLVALPNGTVISLLPVATTQIIHNSSYTLAASVDVYLGDDLFLDDFNYLTSTGLTFVPTRTPLPLGFAPPNSTSSAEILFAIPVTFEDGKSTVVMATGIPQTAQTFELLVYDQARFLAEDPSQVDLLAFHGSEGSPAVDIVAEGAGPLFEDLSYGGYDGYLSVDPTNYFLQIFPSGTDDLLATYGANLTGLNGLAMTVFAGGIIDGTPGFGLYAALADGTVISLPALSKTQVIHNAANPTVDVYLNDDLGIDNFAFRTATPYIYLPSGVDINLGIAPETSTASSDAIFNKTVNLETGKNYIVMATGIVGDANTPFDLNIFDGAREGNDAGEVDILLYHGSTDAPGVDALAGGGVLFDDASYGDFQGYVSVDPLTYKIDVTPADDNNTIVASYTADLTGAGGAAITVFASGFLSGDDPAFGLWVALPDGQTFPLSDVTSTGNIDLVLNSFEIAPNPVQTTSMVTLNITKQTRGELAIFDVSGKKLNVVFEGNFSEGVSTYNLNASDLSEGIYFLTVKTDLGMMTKPLVVTK